MIPGKLTGNTSRSAVTKIPSVLLHTSLATIVPPHKIDHQYFRHQRSHHSRTATLLRFDYDIYCAFFTSKLEIIDATTVPRAFIVDLGVDDYHLLRY
jgi:hypothetical protein